VEADAVLVLRRLRAEGLCRLEAATAGACANGLIIPSCDSICRP
jgi:hypothetical protein